MAIKKIHVITILTLIALLGSVLSIPSGVAGSINAIKQFSTKSLSFLGINPPTPYNSVQYFDIQDPFDIPSLDLTPSPIIHCSIFNNIHLIGTDGSDYTIPAPTNALFTPTLSLVIPNGKTLATVHAEVYLYCQQVSSYFASIGYYPYLTGGTINMQLAVHGSNGVWTTVPNPQSQSVSLGSIPINGKSYKIASFDFPASTIQTYAGNPTNDYISDSSLTVSGNLLFKQKLAYNVQFQHTLSPVTNFFGLVVKGTQQNNIIQNLNPYPQSSGPNCASQYATINGKCISLRQVIVMQNPSTGTNYNIDKSKSDIVSFGVSIDNFNNNGLVLDVNPVVDVYRMPDTTNPIKTIIFGGPNAGTTGISTNWSQSISVKNDLGGTVGKYVLTLRSQILPAGNQRYQNSAGFSVIDSTQGVPTNLTAKNLTSTNFGDTQLMKSYFIWTGVYTNGYSEQAYLGKVPTFSVSLVKQDLISNIDPKKNSLHYFKIQPMIDTSTVGIGAKFSNVNITSETITTLDPGNANKILADVTSSNTGSGGGFGGGPFNDFGGGQQQITPDIQVSPSDINNAITSTGLTPNDGTLVNVKVLVSGTFDVLVNGKNYHGILSTMSFSKDFTWYQNPVNPAPVNCNTNPGDPSCSPPSGACALNPSAPACTSTAGQPGSTGGYCQNLTPDQCAIIGNQITHKQNNDPNGNCNSSDPTQQCVTNNSFTTTCNNILGKTTICQDQTGSTNPGQQTNVGGNKSPSGSSGNSGLCTIVDQNCINSIVDQIQVPQINQNVIIVGIVAAIAISLIVYVIKKKRAN